MNKERLFKKKIKGNLIKCWFFLLYSSFPWYSMKNFSKYNFFSCVVTETCCWGFLVQVPEVFWRTLKREKRELTFPVGINGNRLVLLPIRKPRDGKVVFAQSQEANFLRGINQVIHFPCCLQLNLVNLILIHCSEARFHLLQWHTETQILSLTLLITINLFVFFIH